MQKENKRKKTLCTTCIIFIVPRETYVEVLEDKNCVKLSLGFFLSFLCEYFNLQLRLYVKQDCMLNK